MTLPLATQSGKAGLTFLNGRAELHCGDMREVIPTLAENSFDSCVCDPPYHLTSIVKRFAKTGCTDKTRSTSGPHQRTVSGFMNQTWDGGNIAFRPETWAAVHRVLKPGAYLIAMSGTRTYHRMACAIEDAGFVIYDQISWAYGQGFPKSHNVARAFETTLCERREAASGRSAWFYRDDGQRMADAPPFRHPLANEWWGWGTALKPAWEPACLARKEIDGTTIENISRWGCGALNIDGCRIEADGGSPAIQRRESARQSSHAPGRPGEYGHTITNRISQDRYLSDHPSELFGRWPANIIHDGSDEVLAAFPDAPGQLIRARSDGTAQSNSVYGALNHVVTDPEPRGDIGSAARFFYAAKADADDRLGSKHPTVKPVDLMQYLVRLVTPPKGKILDPFAGTGTTAEAAFREGFSAVMIEREAEYQADIRRRMELVLSGPDTRARAAMKERMKDKPADHGPLFGGADNDERGGQEDLRSLRGRAIGPIGLKW